MDVKIVADKSKEKVLNNLILAYEAEFSAITKKIPIHDGTFKLDVDLQTTENYLLFDKKYPIGFCVKGEIDGRHDIYEFYVVPSRRNRKLGREFAKNIFSRYQGDWQVRQIEGADKAISFWRKTISEFSNNNFEEQVVNDDYWGRVTKQIFTSI